MVHRDAHRFGDFAVGRNPLALPRCSVRLRHRAGRRAGLRIDARVGVGRTRVVGRTRTTHGHVGRQRHVVTTRRCLEHLRRITVAVPDDREPRCELLVELDVRLLVAVLVVEGFVAQTDDHQHVFVDLPFPNYNQ